MQAQAASVMTALDTDGWAFPDSTCTLHYFVAGTSLCHRWRYAGACSPTPRPEGSHCRICAQEAEKR